MAKVIEGLYYSESHEFVRVEGDFGFIGITDYAQNALGNVVYVDMPDVDDDVEAGEEFGAVESVKAASDLFSPVSGKVVEVNEALEDQPELINQDAFENWIIKVELSDKSELDAIAILGYHLVEFLFGRAKPIALIVGGFGIGTHFVAHVEVAIAQRLLEGTCVCPIVIHTEGTKEHALVVLAQIAVEPEEAFGFQFKEYGVDKLHNIVAPQFREQGVELGHQH